MTAIAIQEYQDAMRQAVCSLCAIFRPDSRDPGRCIHESSGQCSLFAHLPGVVESVSRVKNGSIEPYVAELQRVVCAHCDHQDNRGICDLRDNRGPVPVWCILDAYFNLIVGAIEEVQERHAG